MPKKEQKPQIRFKGFTDDWEQRKLDDMCSIVTKQTGFDYSATIKPSLVNEPNDNTYPFIQNKDFNGVNINYSTDFHIPKVIAESFPKILIDRPSLLISISGKIGNVGLYINDNKAFIGGAVGICKLKNPKDGLLTLYHLLSEAGQNYFSSLIKASSHSNITVEDIRKLPIFIPKNDNEKEMLGKFFTVIDNLITLHQRKYEKLKNIKKSMLEKMFPKNENKIPEIRFKGFTDDWEQRKLNYYLETSTEKNIKKQYDKIDVFSVSGDFGIVNQIEFQGRSFAGASVANYGIVNTGDIVYTKSPLSSNPYGIIKTNKLKPGIVSTLYAVYHPKKNTFSNFVQTYFEQNTRVNNYLHPLVNKGAKNDMKVSNDNALEGEVIFPSYDEQKRIYEYFEALDNLITLHQRKYEKLKNIKKSMLEKMFV